MKMKRLVLILLTSVAASCNTTPAVTPYPISPITPTIDNTPTSPTPEQLPIVVMLHASWCNICRRCMPTMYQLEEEYGEQIRFMYIDVNDVSAEQQPFFERTTSSTGVNLPIFGFFDAEHNRINRQFGWMGEWRLREYLRELVPPR